MQAAWFLFKKDYLIVREQVNRAGGFFPHTLGAPGQGLQLSIVEGVEGSYLASVAVVYPLKGYG
jgi:hypothetical protein